MVVVASEVDDKINWVRTGQVFERLALKLTALNLKNALLNQPMEVADIRAQFQSAMELGAHLPRSLRRPLEQVLVRPS